MQFSKTAFLSILALSTSIMAAPKPKAPLEAYLAPEYPENTITEREASLAPEYPEDSFMEREASLAPEYPEDSLMKREASLAPEYPEDSLMKREASLAPEYPEGSLVEASAEGAHEKRVGHIIAITLMKVIGGKLLSGAASAGIEVAKAALEGENPNSFKDFGEARRHFTPEMAKDFYQKRDDPAVQGVACFNQGYHFGKGDGKREGPVTIKYKWDMYHVDYDCFELYRNASIYSDGDGGYENLAYYGVCVHQNNGYECY